jgi:hypothetical protein
MPDLIWLFSEIKDIYTASINVLLDQPLHISKFDCTTLPIPWWDVGATHSGCWAVERFSFVRIHFEYPVPTEPHRAWFYIGYNSSYFRDPTRFEIITEKIEELTVGERCRVHIPILGKFVAYYNGSRIHRSLDKDAPFHRAIESVGIIKSQLILGGLHHQYSRI